MIQRLNRGVRFSRELFYIIFVETVASDFVLISGGYKKDAFLEVVDFD